jgi:predicted Ser/Thr protein kinase
MSHPSHLGRFSIVKVIGKGSMGVVYAAIDPKTSQRVALKTINKEEIDEEHSAEIMIRFQREAEVMAGVRHPNIVSIIEFAEDQGIPYIAMELVEGRELQEFIAAGIKFDLRQIRRVMRQVLEALAFCHRQGIFHRDLKPGNLILNKNGTVKIADFGVARVENSNITQLGAVLGSPNYMSPEQIGGQRVDARSDLYSICVILYELLTGNKPFTGRTFMALVYAISNSTPTPPSHFREDLPPAFDLLVEKGLAKHPEDRFTNAAEFINALEKAVVGEIAPCLLIKPTRPAMTDHEAPPEAAEVAEGEEGGFDQTTICKPGVLPKARPVAPAVGRDMDRTMMMAKPAATQPGVSATPRPTATQPGIAAAPRPTAIPPGVSVAPRPAAIQSETAAAQPAPLAPRGPPQPAIPAERADRGDKTIPLGKAAFDRTLLSSKGPGTAAIPPGIPVPPRPAAIPPGIPVTPRPAAIPPGVPVAPRPAMIQSETAAAQPAPLAPRGPPQPAIPAERADRGDKTIPLGKAAFDRTLLSSKGPGTAAIPPGVSAVPRPTAIPPGVPAAPRPTATQPGVPAVPRPTAIPPGVPAVTRPTAIPPGVPVAPRPAAIQSETAAAQPAPLAPRGPPQPAIPADRAERADRGDKTIPLGAAAFDRTLLSSKGPETAANKTLLLGPGQSADKAAEEEADKTLPLGGDRSTRTP